MCGQVPGTGIQCIYMKNIWLIGAALIIIAGGVYGYLSYTADEIAYEKPDSTVVPGTTTPVTNATDTTPVGENPDEETPAERGATTDIGTSVDGTKITAYHFGTGEREVLLIGGIHGGYSKNTAKLGYELTKWFTDNEDAIPEDVTVTIVPLLNPDGYSTVVGEDGTPLKNISEATTIASRFNANNVDLNRNFDCQWQAKGTWQSRSVSGGTAPFSEPESAALRDYVAAHEPSAVVAWYSAAGGVYASKCDGDILPAGLSLMNSFAKASGYTAHKDYDYYEITGDMVNWFAKNDIPAFSVLLSDHTSTEFEKNRLGVIALITSVSGE
jgi:Zinc carboxypeptidase